MSCAERSRFAGHQVGTAAHVTGTVPAADGPAPRPGRLAVPLAQRRCQQADTNRVGQVTDHRIAIGQANNQHSGQPLMSTANMTSLRRPGNITGREANEPEPVRCPDPAHPHGTAEVPGGQARADRTGGGGHDRRINRNGSRRNRVIGAPSGTHRHWR